MSNRRLIEEELPLTAVNAASAREKSLRHGHISTLHLWWARRPLAMSRTVVYGTLLPDPGDEERPYVLKELADAAEFEASVQPSRIEPLRRRLLDAYGGRAPKVLDCFAGGGAIPLEALRLGCDTTALDLNPVAHLIEKGTLEFPQRFGTDASGGNPLAEAFVRWAGWMKARAETELIHLFPRRDGEGRPSVFFWCRTMTCPNPGCGTEVPLLSSMRLADGNRRQMWLRFDPSKDPIGIELVDGVPPSGVNVKEGTVRAGSMTCPRCRTAMSGPDVRAHAKRVPFGARLYAVLDVAGRHRAYRSPSEDELRAALNATDFLERFDELEDGTSELPDEPVDPIGYNNLQNLPYGYTTWRSLFTDRQLAVLGTLCRTVRAAHAAMLEEGIEPEFAAAVATYLGMCVDRIADYNSAFASWHYTGEFVRNTFPQQVIRMSWDFVEIDPFGDASGTWDGAVRWMELAMRHCRSTGDTPATVQRGNAQELPFEDGTFDAVVVDPPYYYSVMYSDLSDFFYVWLKRSIGFLYPELFVAQWTPKAQEVIQNRVRPSDPRYISGEEFELRLERSLREIARVVKDDGVVSIVFAHTDVAAWEKLLNALRTVGLVVTTSWPMRSEMPNRPLAQVKAALGSSVVLMCRRQGAEAVGFYDDVVHELEARIGERLDSFEGMGLVGADYFASAVGPAFEVFARYASITRLSGEEVTVSELMVLARQVVARRAMRQLLGDESLIALDGVSLFYLTWRWAYLTADVPADEAYKLERAFDVDLGGLTGHGRLVERHGSTFQVLGPHERRDLELSVAPALIDVLHLACKLWDTGQRADLADLLGATGMGGEPAFWAVARVLAEVLPPDSTERRMLLGMGGNRDTLERAAANSTASFEELTLFHAG
jgi:adenine-specific DNA methylase